MTNLISAPVRLTRKVINWMGLDWEKELASVSDAVKAMKWDYYSPWLHEIHNCRGFKTLPAEDVNVEETVRAAYSGPQPERPENWDPYFKLALDLVAKNIGTEPPAEPLLEYIKGGEWARSGSSGQKVHINGVATRLTKAQAWVVLPAEEILKDAETGGYTEAVFIKEEIGKARPALAGKDLGTYVRSDWILNGKDNSYEKIPGTALEHSERDAARRVETIMAWVKAKGLTVMALDAEKFDSQPTQVENRLMVGKIYDVRGFARWVKAMNIKSYDEAVLLWERLRINMTHGMPTGVRETTASGVLWNQVMIGMARGMACKLCKLAGLPLEIQPHYVRGDDSIMPGTYQYNLLTAGVILSFGYRVGLGKGTLMKEGEFLRARYTTDRTYKYMPRRAVSVVSRKPWSRLEDKDEVANEICRGLSNLTQRLPEGESWFEALAKAYLHNRHISTFKMGASTWTRGSGSFVSPPNAAVFDPPKKLSEAEFNPPSKVPPYVLEKLGDDPRTIENLFTTRSARYGYCSLAGVGKVSDLESALLAAEANRFMQTCPVLTDYTNVSNNLTKPQSYLDKPRAYWRVHNPAAFLRLEELRKSYPYSIAVSMVAEGLQYPRCPWPEGRQVWDHLNNNMSNFRERVRHLSRGRHLLRDFVSSLVPVAEVVRRWVRLRVNEI